MEILMEVLRLKLNKRLNKIMLALIITLARVTAGHLRNRQLLIRSLWTRRLRTWNLNQAKKITTHY